MKKIAILLTVYNRKEKTMLCLQNVFNQIIPVNHALEVYMVDDGCTDGTPELVKKHYPLVNIIHGNGNLFWNRGMYIAWTTAAEIKAYDFYLWLNDDTKLFEGALEVLLKTSLLKKDIAIVVGSTNATNNPKKVTYGGRSHTQGLIIPQKEPVPCDYFNGNIVLIPYSVYKEAGTNDPVYHHALGDFDYGLSAVELGVSLYVAPGFLGACDVHESLPTWCNPRKKFKHRWKAFRSPLGNNPEEFFIFEVRHNGLLKAIFHYITNHLRVLLPSLWNKKNML